mmetsp:Transcript_7273/g.19039  ORF Transcript_7273/g.19039 Transcript_7273/m.19039 type:complete len:423 (+) Transcript_7273:561-1829(+)
MHDPSSIASAAAILSGCFGLEGCVGIGNSPDNAASHACNVVNTTDAVGRVMRQTSVPPNALFILCESGAYETCSSEPCDAIPTTFNFPVDSSTLDASDFRIVRSDGSEATPVCAPLFPANEPNEAQTVALIGHFGGRVPGTWPTAVKVVGPLTLLDPFTQSNLEAKGLILHASDGTRPYGTVGAWVGSATLPIANLSNYGQSLEYTSGLVILRAYAFPFSTRGEVLAGRNYPNHCRVNFPQTTHVIKLLMNGGATLDGVHSFLPSDTSIFDVGLRDGQVLDSAQFLGLADLGAAQEASEVHRQTYVQDGDNYIDLCLRVTEGVYFDLAVVTTRAGLFFPPRGTGPNSAHGCTITHAGISFPYEMDIVTPFNAKLLSTISVAILLALSTCCSLFYWLWGRWIDRATGSRMMDDRKSQINKSLL